MDDILKILYEEINDLVDNYKIKDTVGYIVTFEDWSEYWDSSSRSISDYKTFNSDDDLDDAIKLAKEVKPFENFDDAMKFIKYLERNKQTSDIYEDYRFSIRAVIYRSFDAAFTKKIEV